ncbi:P27 family phage terminase small subunit [Pectobacterium aroidearum]|uniref:P27 family phage terminase small subunit n=1 Tax=Pectobacterium aroidearum TaxID=1201031 RepID=A0ABR5ZJR3_9GAMM|nr:P27 family phage terminase small subunit [Pectobacterium aroidearum]MBA5234764.1 P27 family phage terminase small subunit [Pectobacterium aroidearum]MBA5739943.1 P27 family phage terminase small subunit [Pectobacterium aroidearum]
MATGMRSPGGGRKANNTGEMTSSVTRSVTPPDELLGDMAIDAWRRTCKIMVKRGTFEVEDGYLLMAYCNTVQLLYDAEQEIKNDGIGDETAAGGQKLGAATKARDKLISQLIRLSVVLKLDPGSRMIRNPGGGNDKKENEFSEF